MIYFEKVSYEYEKNNPALNNISFTINKGEAAGLIGANGAGKSTLMKVLLGLLPHSKGKIKVDNIEVKKETLNIIRQKAGFVLSNSDNQMFMPTVREDIMFAPLNYGMDREEAEKITDEVLNKLGITDLKYRYNHKISSGEKRMAAIAAALAMNPDVLIMDEPTSNLDPYNRRIVINTINSLKKTKIIASHDLDMIYETCGRVILISKGRIIADDKAEIILKNKELLEDCRLELPIRFVK